MLLAQFYITPEMNFNTNRRYVGRNTIVASGNVIMIDKKINALGLEA